MIILKLQAGLGNQMFQYAYARALALRGSKVFNEPVELALDLGWFENISQRDTKRPYGLNHFNIQARIIDERDAKKILGFKDSSLFKLARKIQKAIRRKIFGWSDYVFYPSACKPRKNACIEGYYWNSELYFKDFAEDIRRELSLKEPLGSAATEIKREIESISLAGKLPVLLHVRRGDYVTNVHAQSFHGAKDASYYKKAVDRLIKEIGQDKESLIHFFAVSDDIDWVRQNIKPTSSSGQSFPVTHISKPEIKDYEEMHLMSLCHHHIIANSTFSWWGAWLSANQKKVVIGPKVWVNNPAVNTNDVMPESWIRI